MIHTFIRIVASRRNSCLHEQLQLHISIHFLYSSLFLHEHITHAKPPLPRLRDLSVFTHYVFFTFLLCIKLSLVLV